jgi:hypothetical protein
MGPEAGKAKKSCSSLAQTEISIVLISRILIWNGAEYKRKIPSSRARAGL